jgi:hypothetical protein
MEMGLLRPEHVRVRVGGELYYHLGRNPLNMSCLLAFCISIRLAIHL